MKAIRRWAATALLFMLSPAGAALGSASDDPGSGHRVSFQRSLINLEYSVKHLVRVPPEGLQRVPMAAHGDLWYGVVDRGVDPPAEPGTIRDAIFEAEFEHGVPTRAWFDANRDGDLTDDPPVELYAYDPGGRDSRSMIVDLHWTAPHDSGIGIPVNWKVRIVLEPPESSSGSPIYRTQMVYGMEGTVVLEGRPHRAVLYDGNLDGIYSKSFADGMFVDLDDDSHLDVDPMSPEFAPFTVPFQMGRHRYQVERVDPRGTEVVLRDLGEFEPVGPPRIGFPAPDFRMEDLDGRAHRLADYRGKVVFVYFWSSWCGTCAYQAAQLVDLYRHCHGKGFEILSISYDSDRGAMEALRRRYDESWPTSFTGTRFWENPVGQVYRAGGAGLGFLIDRDGKVDGKFTDIPQLAERVRLLIGATQASGAR